MLIYLTVFAVLRCTFGPFVESGPKPLPKAIRITDQ